MGLLDRINKRKPPQGVTVAEIRRAEVPEDRRPEWVRRMNNGTVPQGVSGSSSLR